MSGFDTGASVAAGMFGESQRIAEQQKLQRQAKLSAIVGDSLNNLPLPKDENGNPDVNNPVYQDIYNRRQKLIGSLVDEYTPTQHANLVQRIGGLITGNKKGAEAHPNQPLPTYGTGPHALQAQAAHEQGAQAQQDLAAGQTPPQPAAPPVPQHPMAPLPPDHPANKITEGLAALKNHLAAFAHPIPNKPDQSELVNNLASSYADPAQLAAERAKALETQKEEAAQKLWGVRGQTSIDVAKIRSQYQLLNTPEKARLDSGAKSLGYDNFPTAPPDVQDSLLKQYKTATRAPAKNIVVDPSSPTGYSAAEWDTGTGQIISHFSGVLPPRGFVPTDKVTEDAFGNKTISKTTPEIGKGAALPPDNPITSGMPISSAAPAMPSSAPTIVPTNPGARLPGTQPIGGAVKAKPISSATPSAPSSQPAPLDADGHIPEGVGNPLVRQFANNLLDGQDSKDIPNPGARAAAERMASQYGWGRGAFTPREKIQFQTATTFLHQLQDSPSLNVLDSFISREKIARAMKDPKSMGMLDRIAAYNLDPKEAEFLRLYNAAVGTVQGLSSITRAGRASEASVNRLKTELPNVLQSSSSTDAKGRIDQLLKEADVALNTNPKDVGKKGPVSANAPTTPPKVGDTKTFPNGKIGKWDGQGYVAQ